LRTGLDHLAFEVANRLELGLWTAEIRQAGRVGQQVPHERTVLARGGELRPVPGDRRGQVQVAAVGKDKGAQRQHRLGRGPHAGDRVALPRDCPGRVGKPVPQVSHQLAVQVDSGRGANIIIQRLCQRFTHGTEPLIAHTMDLGHGPNLTRPAPVRATG